MFKCSFDKIVWLFVIFISLQAFSQQNDNMVTDHDTLNVIEKSETITINTFQVHNAWDLYNPPTFEPTSWKPNVPGKDQLKNELMVERDMIIQHRYGKEIRELKIKINEDSTDVQSLNELGVLFAENSFFETGQFYFKQALKIDSTFGNAHLNVGNIFYETGEYETAKSKYLLALEMCEAKAKVHYNLSLVEFQLNNLNEATRYFEKAKDLEKDIDKDYFPIDITKTVGGTTRRASEAEVPHPIWIK